MKYALINQKGRVLKTSSDEFISTSEGTEVVQITNARAAAFESSDTPLFLVDGELVSLRKKLWLNDAESVKASLRPKRNCLLAESDWTQLSDSPLSEGQIVAWSTYRRDLRDLTDNIDENGEVEFPLAP